MKTCPYCKEVIKDDAAKCHHCQTVILPATTEAAIRDKRVILVVDRGLIYFGKFAGIVLTVFITVGLVVYGVDLKETAEDARNYRNQAQALVDSTRIELREATGKLEAYSGLVDELAERAELLDDVLAAQKSILKITAPLVAAMAHTEGNTTDEVYELHKLLPAFCELVRDSQGEAEARAKLGDVALLREDKELARSEYEKARTLFEQLGEVTNQARISLNLAMVELQLDRAEQARRIYNEAVELYEEVEDYAGLANAYFGLAGAEEKLGHTEEASWARKQAQAVSPYQVVPR